VIGKLLAQWSLLPAPIQEQVDKRRHALTTELRGQSTFGRAQTLVKTLEWLESIPQVARLAQSELQQGKGQSMRSAAQIADAQLEPLQAALEAPIPQPAAGAANRRIELEFQVQIDFPTEIDPNESIPCTVKLIPRTANTPATADIILVTFDDLEQAVPLEVTLSAPDFSEQSGSSSRTILAYANRDSLPAVFMLEASVGGNGRMAVNFAQPVGSVGQQTTLREVGSKGLEVMRGSHSPTRSATLQTVEFSTKVNFPGQVQVGISTPLVVQLVLQEPKADETVAAGKFAVTFANAHKPEWIEVVVSAPGFVEMTSNPRRVLLLYPHVDSPPTLFLLQAKSIIGPANITLDFYHGGRLVLSTVFSTEITRDAPVMPAAAKPKHADVQMEQLPATPIAAPDITLRVTLDAASNTLHYRLHSEKLAVDCCDLAVGSKKLNAEPRHFLAGLFERLSQQAATPDPDPSELENMGEGLFEGLFSPELKQVYWRLKALREAGIISTFLIISDEPWIPWELVKPYQWDDAQNVARKDGFLAESFQLCRWLPDKRSPAAAVAVTVARLVAPDLDLPEVKRERDFFAELEKRGVQVGKPLTTRSEVLHETRSGKMKLLHVAAHGDFKAQNANTSEIALQNGETLNPDALAGSASEAVRRERPLVFLNVCHGAQQEFALTGLGGWTDQFLNTLGASAFVGALWAVNDALAGQFAVAFYEQLSKGESFAAACHAARLVIRQQSPANPTWLAYTLYADPNGRVTWGAAK
jgi:hypothetical protein